MSLINIMGVDPGKNLGVSILTIEDTDLTIKNIQTFIYYLDNSIFSSLPMMDKLDKLNKSLESLLYNFRPVAFCFEQAFKHRFANAVIQLSQYTALIEYTAYKFDPYMLIYKYPPKFIKKLFGATGDADKNGMLKRFLSINELKGFYREDMTEHEIDATAIAYITLNNIRSFPYRLLLNRDSFNHYR